MGSDRPDPQVGEDHGDTIPVNVPLLDGNERRYLMECVETGWVSSEGPFVRRFEEALAARVGRRFGIAVANGTAALQVALRALSIGPGDEVVLPTFTIISCAVAVVRAGATPVLVDSDPDTWNPDVRQIERVLTPRTKAIMPVHTYGLPADLEPLLALARDRGVSIIEDAAELHGQTYRGRACGSFGDLSTFSFYANKNVTAGEGGMVLTDDPELAERCRSLRNLCFQASRRFVHEELGWNFRLSNLQAAVGLAQLERLDDHLERKRRMGERYSHLLKGLEGFQLPLAEADYAKSIYWVFGLVSKRPDLDARTAMMRLGGVGVGTRPFFWPMHEQPVFRRMGLFERDRHPVAEGLARNGFYIPSGLGLTEGQIDRVAARLLDLFG